MPDVFDLSILIVSYNTASITQTCVQSVYSSLLHSSIKFEVIVIDNASQDESVTILNNMSQQYRNLKVIPNKTNIGFAKANNQAVKLAKGEYILLLNSDTVILDHAIDDMYAYFKKSNSIHFLGPKLLNKNMTPQASAAPFYTLPVIFAALFLKGDYWGASRSSPNEPTRIDWVSGACIFTKKGYFEQLGGFDEHIFMYMDEVDLLYRASLKKMQTFFYPNAHIIHLGSASSNKTYPILQVYRGFLYFYKKHYSALPLFCLKIMLQLKALIALGIGVISNNQYLKETYAQALTLARQ